LYRSGFFLLADATLAIFSGIKKVKNVNGIKYKIAKESEKKKI
jgi:hypothetical protein